MNKVILMGRLTKDPMIETTAAWTLYTKFTIAVDRRFAKEGSQQADFIPVTAWGKTAEFITMYFKKGVRMAIVGSLEVNSFQDRETMQNRTFTQVRADEVYFADGKRDNNQNTAQFGSFDNQNQIRPNNVKDDVQFTDISESSAFNIDNVETIDDIHFDE